MWNRTFWTFFVTACTVFVLASPVRAIDYGDVVYGKDMKGSLRAELVLERFDRDVKHDISQTIVGSDGNTYFSAAGDDTDGMDQGAYLFRLSFPLQNNACIYLDAGMLDDSNAKSTPWMIGIGGRVKLYDKNKLRLHAIGSAHFVPSYDIEKDIVYVNNPNWVFRHASGTETYYEMGAGILASTTIQANRGLSLIPYGGLVFSVLHGNSDCSGTLFSYNYGPYTIGASVKEEDDISEDTVPIIVAGLSFLIDRTFSFRVEARFAGDSSISAGFGMSF